MVSLNAEFEVSSQVLCTIEEILDSDPVASSVPFAFRRFASDEIPELIECAEDARAQVGRYGVVVVDLPFAPFHGERDSAVVRFLLMCWVWGLGIPTKIDRAEGRILWPVTTQSPRANWAPTFTENRSAVPFHTDSSYNDWPERVVFLYAVRQDSGGGGMNSVISGQEVLDHLADTEEGAECLQVLRCHPVPFRRPDSFTRLKRHDVPESIEACVLADEPMIRFRHDRILRGFDLAPALATERVRHAVDRFARALGEVQAERLLLREGQALLIDNHRWLHARSAFKGKRLLFRARVNDLPQSLTAVPPDRAPQRA